MAVYSKAGRGGGKQKEGQRAVLAVVVTLAMLGSRCGFAQRSSGASCLFTASARLRGTAPAGRATAAEGLFQTRTSALRTRQTTTTTTTTPRVVEA